MADKKSKGGKAQPSAKVRSILASQGVKKPLPGEDWALSPDRRRLFVSLPGSNQIVVVDTLSTYFGLRTIARGRYGDAP